MPAFYHADTTSLNRIRPFVPKVPLFPTSCNHLLQPPCSTPATPPHFFSSNLQTPSHNAPSFPHPKNRHNSLTPSHPHPYHPFLTPFSFHQFHHHTTILANIRDHCKRIGKEWSNRRDGLLPPERVLGPIRIGEPYSLVRISKRSSTGDWRSASRFRCRACQVSGCSTRETGGRRHS